MRTAHPFPFLLHRALRQASLYGGLALAASAAFAQSPASAASASLPDPATLRELQHTPLPSGGGWVTEPVDWRTAHSAVAQFPRGHADVLRWEAAQAQAQQAAAPMPAATAAAPAHAACPMMASPPASQPAHHHGGQP